MKKTVISLLLLAIGTLGLQAQEVFKEVRRLANTVANDTTKDITTRKIATFKVDALDYMQQKYYYEMSDSSVQLYKYVLDHQALALYEYVDLFMKRLTPLKKKKEREQIVEAFKEASLGNSKFFDMDKDLVEAYILTPGYLTQFSLDTDWEKALEDVRQRLRRLP